MTARSDETASEDETVFSCPDCARDLTELDGVLACPGCGYVPRQGSD